jgi:hypothetical protein
MFFKRSEKKTSLLGIISGTAIGLSLILLVIAGLFLFPQTKKYLSDSFEQGTLETIDFKSLTSTNHEEGFLLCPIDICIDFTADETSPEFEITSIQLRKILFEFIDSQGSISLQNLDMTNQNFDFIERTPSMRFPDIITVQLYELSPNRSTVAIYSRSVKGYENKERNKKRVERWVDFITPR